MVFLGNLVLSVAVALAEKGYLTAIVYVAMFPLLVPSILASLEK